MIERIKKTIQGENYDFLRTNKHLGNNICLLTLGGSLAYGTNTPDSDIDIRGISSLTTRDILLGQDFEQVTNVATDTVVYSVNKMFNLLSACNPNVIEMLGCKPEHYIYLNEIGQKILDNKELFLSQKCIHSFGGYANAQLRRLQNLSVREISQSEKEHHVLNTINCAKYSFSERYPIEQIDLYIDKSEQANYDTEIYFDINLKHYPLRDYVGMIDEFKSIIKSYSKTGKRNDNALNHKKIGKHMMHLIRLYLMGIDILEKGKIITYREKEHDLLMTIRNNAFIKDGLPIPEFFDLLNEIEKKFEYAKKNTSLPETTNMEAINELKYEINKEVIRKEL